VTFCHATSSASNPYVLITTSASGAVHGHMRHHGQSDVFPSFSYRGKAYGDAAGTAFVAAGCVTPAPPGDGGGGDEL
jgi:hypothetical protein